MASQSIHIVEVGARDGLQNEPEIVSTDHKVELITRAMDAGLRRFEVASFVHPKRVPQMADAEAVIAALPDRKDVSYIGLCLNKRGVMRGLATKEGGKRGIDEAGCVILATDTFGMKNQGQTVEAGIRENQEMIRLAKAEGLTAQVTISAAFGCPFEGEVDTKVIVDIAKALTEAEPSEIALADTIGVGVPSQVRDLVGAVKDVIGAIPLRAHFHNTRNTGIANALAAAENGVDVLDASIAGLGGCPFAPKATGNIATEDLIYMMDRSDIGTGVDLTNVIEIAHWIETVLGRETPAMVSKAGGFPSAA